MCQSSVWFPYRQSSVTNALHHHWHCWSSWCYFLPKMYKSGCWILTRQGLLRRETRLKTYPEMEAGRHTSTYLQRKETWEIEPDLEKAERKWEGLCKYVLPLPAHQNVISETRKLSSLRVSFCQINCNLTFLLKTRIVLFIHKNMLSCFCICWVLRLPWVSSYLVLYFYESTVRAESRDVASTVKL